jgi:ectoine hydroxylase-related dioxygenase (phytanoyl-CoA dioxygenase family)
MTATRPAEPAVHLAGAPLAEIEATFHEFGFVVLRHLFDGDLMDRMTRECAAAQAAVLAGAAPEGHGSVKYLDEASKVERFVNYVERVEDLSPAVLEAATSTALRAVVGALIGPDHWLNTQGIVYQDARPGRESGYTRIGWHSDWQAAPSLDVWPSVAFTFHIDGTSPANGFLRAVPGSHLWATPAPYRNVNGVVVPDDAKPAGGYTDTPPPFEMPLGFDKVPGEIAVYAEPGDVLLHDAYLWHSAARATDDEGVRRHVRSGYFTGDRESWTDRPQFLKNAAR